MILLNETSIHAHLEAHPFNKPYVLHCVKTIDSTNRFLTHLTTSDPLTICCAEEQTAGRGRLGRHWNSPFGENIYLSVRIPSPATGTALAGFSLVIALAISDCLHEHTKNDDFLIKWPNDILWHDKKLCGILIEITPQYVVIGIGLNVNSAARSTQLSDKPRCSLLEVTGQTFDRNALIAGLVMHLDRYVDRFFKNGFADFQSDWEPLDYLKGQWITVSQPQGTVSGQALGVNAHGHLCLKDAQSEMQVISSGEATILR